jgi:hypothetical protein
MVCWFSRWNGAGAGAPAAAAAAAAPPVCCGCGGGFPRRDGWLPSADGLTAC